MKIDQNNYSIEGDKGHIILNIITKFSTSYSELIEGKFVKDTAVDCLGGSRINYIFHGMFVKSIKDIDPF
jgi:dynamin 1-like protein